MIISTKIPNFGAEGQSSASAPFSLLPPPHSRRSTRDFQPPLPITSGKTFSLRLFTEGPERKIHPEFKPSFNAIRTGSPLLGAVGGSG